MKKIAVLLTTVLTAGMLAACGQGKNAETTSAGVSDVKTEADSVPEAKPEKDAITFKLGMVDPDGSNFHKGALAIAEEVNKATGGRITIQVFAGGQLGNERDSVRGAQMVPLTCLRPPTQYSPLSFLKWRCLTSHFYLRQQMKPIVLLMEQSEH